jgi:hypothetical protein
MIKTSEINLQGQVRSDFAEKVNSLEGFRTFLEKSSMFSNLLKLKYAEKTLPSVIFLSKKQPTKAFHQQIGPLYFAIHITK